MSDSFVTVNGVTLELHPSGPRAWSPVDANRILREIGDGAQAGVTLSTLVQARSADDVLQGYDGDNLKSFLPGADTWDIRDFATGVAVGNSTKDTDALVAAAAQISSSVTSTNAQPGQIRFPRGELLLEEQLTIYGGNSTASAWIGEQGRSKGYDGTTIRWAGGTHYGPMIHSLGMNGALFQDLTLVANYGGARARFCWWAESNQRNGGAGSSDCTWRDCTFADFGHMGVGMVCGDEVRAVVTMSGVTGTFQPGEFVLDVTDDTIATVVSHVGAALSIKEVIGGGFSGGAISLLGLTSGATATGTGWVVDSDYQGNRQFSEGHWDHCLFTGSGIHSTIANAGWAGWATFGANNNKNYTFDNPRIYGTRYFLDWGWGSGILTVDSAIGGVVGHAGKGAYLRASNGAIDWRNGEMENGEADYECRLFDLNNVTGRISGGEYTGILPSDNTAIKFNFGALTVENVRIKNDNGVPSKITFGGGSLELRGVQWDEDFTGYLPIQDAIGGNELGTGDYSRNNDFALVAEGCIANCYGGLGAIRRLPDIRGQLVSPQRNQLWDDSISDVTVVRRGTLSRVVETRTVTYSQVIAAGGTVDFAKTRLKSIVHGIIADVTQTFRGGALSAVSVKVGDNNDDDIYLLPFSGYTATGQFGLVSGDIGFTPHPFGGVLQPWAAYRTLRATFTPTGAAISALTQGSVTFYVIYEVL